MVGFSRGPSGKEPTCQCGRPKRRGFSPWVRKIPWRRVWQPTPVLLPGEILWTEEPDGLQSMGSQRVGHDWSDLACMHNPIRVLLCFMVSTIWLGFSLPFSYYWVFSFVSPNSLYYKKMLQWTPLYLSSRAVTWRVPLGYHLVER